MQRREFLSGAASVAATIGVASEAQGQTGAAGTQPEYYLLRRYSLTRAQAAGCDHFLESALLPALARLGYRDPGAFGLEYGPETPSTYLLLRHAETGKLLRLEDELLHDDAFQEAGRSFLSASVAQPAYQRVEDTLLQAFAGHPVLTPAARGKHIVQLRTYESSSAANHLQKVKMFHSGEFEIFQECGMHAVFYAHNLVGARLPSLTYMLSFESLAEMEQRWAAFRVNPAWKKLSADPRFSKEDLVSNITNLLLSPKAFSAV